MIKQIVAYLSAWVRGEDAELHIDTIIHISWAELAIIMGVIGYLIYHICR